MFKSVLLIDLRDGNIQRSLAHHTTNIARDSFCATEPLTFVTLTDQGKKINRYLSGASIFLIVRTKCEWRVSSDWRDWSPKGRIPATRASGAVAPESKSN
jgi:hypothetical protein